MVQQQLLQSSKMASIGQLAAGVAHEINNPISFVKNNLSMLHKYMLDVRKYFKDQEPFFKRK
ncbi:histidine kinase dimerization/phospho-acceptor domain-containing protein [Piscirickettsia litoralis]|nr:histidine kinase dimerization/phospho-acceptor domain-containing protein [Piscirickettsia litoralis]